MPDGRFRRYYWQIRALLSEKAHLLNVDHPTYKVCEDYEVEYTGAFRGNIVFQDGSRLIVRFSLKADDDIEEYDYAYRYLDSQGERILRYDDAPHHPEVSTYPHHLHRGTDPPEHKRDKAYALDVNRGDFATIFSRIVRRYLSE